MATRYPPQTPEPEPFYDEIGGDDDWQGGDGTMVLPAGRWQDAPPLPTGRAVPIPAAPAVPVAPPVPVGRRAAPLPPAAPPMPPTAPVAPPVPRARPLPAVGARRAVPIGADGRAMVPTNQQSNPSLNPMGNAPTPVGRRAMPLPATGMASSQTSIPPAPTPQPVMPPTRRGSTPSGAMAWDEESQAYLPARPLPQPIDPIAIAQRRRAQALQAKALLQVGMDDDDLSSTSILPETKQKSVVIMRPSLSPLVADHGSDASDDGFSSDFADDDEEGATRIDDPKRKMADPRTQQTSQRGASPLESRENDIDVVVGVDAGDDIDIGIDGADADANDDDESASWDDANLLGIPAPSASSALPVKPKPRIESVPPLDAVCELGILSIDAPNSALIFIDGQPRGKGAIKIPNLDRYTTYHIRVHCVGFAPWRSSVVIGNQNTLRVRPELRRRALQS